jgi:hypothetical protein
MNKTLKNLKRKNYKNVCLKAINSKKFKKGMKNMGVTVNVKKLKKNKTFMKEYVNSCVKKLKEIFYA